VSKMPSSFGMIPPIIGRHTQSKQLDQSIFAGSSTNIFPNCRPSIVPSSLYGAPSFRWLSKGEFPNVASNERRVLRRGDYFCLFCPDESRRKACTFGDPHAGAFRRYQAAAIHRRCLYLQSVSSRPRRRRQTDRVRRKLQREQLDCGHSNCRERRIARGSRSSKRQISEWSSK